MKRPLRAPTELGRTQKGFALVAAIFLIVVLAVVFVFASGMGETQEQTADYTLLMARARAAADAGIEYGSNLALKQGTCGTSMVTLPAPAYASFSVKVTCSGPTSHMVNGTPYVAYQIGALAYSGTYGRSDYVARSAARTVKSAPPLSDQ